MCGRYDNLIAREAYRRLVNPTRLPQSNFPPRHNIAPTDQVPIVRIEPRLCGRGDRHHRDAVRRDLPTGCAGQPEQRQRGGYAKDYAALAEKERRLISERTRGSGAKESTVSEAWQSE